MVDGRVDGEFLIRTAGEPFRLLPSCPQQAVTVPKTVSKCVLGAYSQSTARLFLAYYRQKCHFALELSAKKPDSDLRLQVAHNSQLM